MEHSSNMTGAPVTQLNGELVARHAAFLAKQADQRAAVERCMTDATYARANNINPRILERVWRVFSGTDEHVLLQQESQPRKRGIRQAYLFGGVVPAGGSASFQFAPRRKVDIYKIWVAQTPAINDVGIASMLWADGEPWPAGGRGATGSLRYPPTLRAFETAVYEALCSAMPGEKIRVSNEAEFSWTLSNPLAVDTEELLIVFETETVDEYVGG